MYDMLVSCRDVDNLNLAFQTSINFLFWVCPLQIFLSFQGSCILLLGLSPDFPCHNQFNLWLVDWLALVFECKVYMLHRPHITCPVNLLCLWKWVFHQYEMPDLACANGRACSWFWGLLELWRNPVEQTALRPSTTSKESFDQFRTWYSSFTVVATAK